MAIDSKSTSESVLGTKKQYIERLSKMRRNVYYDGHLIDRTDELQMPTINTIGSTYDFARDPKYKDLATAKSHITGKTINRFNHIHQNKEDLHKKQDMTRALCREVGGCIQRCMTLGRCEVLVFRVTGEIIG